MKTLSRYCRTVTLTGAVACATVLSANVQAAPLNISDVPLFLQDSVAPLNLLVLGRDHKLYYEAYNDHSDLDGRRDGPDNTTTLELRYEPGKIEYYGYFDSHKCYVYDVAGVFVPTRTTETKKCGGDKEWSGDWLNYVTTSRIDAMRKVLYGGTRYTDSATKTVLERSHIPQDAHSWGKEYRSEAADGYNIRDYAPYDAPSGSNRHFFANTSLMLNTTAAANWAQPPLLRVALNRPSTQRIWNWVSVESPVAGICVNDGRCEAGDGGTSGPKADDGRNPKTTDEGDTGSGKIMTIEDKIVRVEVCKDNLLEDNCQQYPDGNYKPTGLLHDYGENDTMLFGLLTGSYQRSKSGGVMRKNVASIKDEITTSNGVLTDTVGIIRTIDLLRSTGFANYRGNTWYREAGRGAGTTYLPGLVTNRPFNEGEFGGMWGNPVAEMMYEGLRYFAGKGSPAFDYTNDSSFDKAMGLPKVGSWSNPYANDKPSCAKPFEMVMSDVNLSYDTDQIPGSHFASVSGDLTGFDAAARAQTIWDEEPGLGGTKYVFIGQSDTDSDGSPMPKLASSLGTIRGLAPEEPTKQGGYYAASAAYYGRTTDISDKASIQNVQTFAVALASPLPRIEIPVGAGNITLVPFGKSVKYGATGINSAKGEFQPTNQIVDFYVESLGATSGTFQVNFEDVEAGNDHDMDAIVRYSYTVSGNTVEVTASSDYAAGGIVQHMGYVVSGSTADGIYLVVRDKDTSNKDDDVSYFLDTPPGRTPGQCAPDAATLCPKALQPGGFALPLTSTRTFTAGSTENAAEVLKDPLWYAAKWGGFKESTDDTNNRPDKAAEWDSNGDGNPDNYFLVTNALTLGQQLSAAFKEILERVGSASSASVNSGSISENTRVYQAKFNSATWTGQLVSYPVRADGTLVLKDESGYNVWDAADQMPKPADREIITVNSDRVPVPFLWDSLDATRKAQIEPNYLSDEDLGEDRLEYLRGEAAKEDVNDGGIFRTRPKKLGDIVSSSPIFVGAPSFSYPENLEGSKNPYSAFKLDEDNVERQQIVYVGANDGMLHGFDANTGDEQIAFIPSPVFKNLRFLSDPDYTHKYFVDAPPNMRDAYINGKWQTVLVGGLNKGGQGIYALNITDPSNFVEANADEVVMWEFTDADDADLGYTYSQPAIARLPNGSWGAIFGNGYNNTEDDTATGGAKSSTGNAVLFIRDLASGAKIATIDTGVGAGDPESGGRPNGLSTPAVVDVNGDMIADYVYAGDLFGNMWKFDIRNTDPDKWKIAYGDAANPQPFFTAVDPETASKRQPITSRPEVIRGPRNIGLMVLFGTGKYIETSDKTVDPDDKYIQSYYGLLDRNADPETDPIDGLGTLVEQSITAEPTVTFVDDQGTTATSDDVTTTTKVRITTANDVADAKNGWYMNLLSAVNVYNGERQVSNTAVRAGRVIFTTLIPDSDPCAYGGSSWLMELDALTGKRLEQTPVDFNNDGVFDEDDLVTLVDVDGNVILDANGKPIKVGASGMQPQARNAAGELVEVGIIPAAGILLGEGGTKEFKYIPGTTGEISITTENPGPRIQGRQSWRQIR